MLRLSSGVTVTVRVIVSCMAALTSLLDSVSCIKFYFRNGLLMATYATASLQRDLDVAQQEGHQNGYIAT